MPLGHKGQQSRARAPQDRGVGEEPRELGLRHAEPLLVGGKQDRRNRCADMERKAELAPLARPSETLVWEIHNETAQDRNFHLSGFPFQYLSVTYSDDDFPEINQTFDAPFPEWMDTILIPKRPGRSERSRTIVRVLCELDDWRREGKITAAGLIPKPSQAGGWQFGTSMLEARDRGMRAALQIR